MNPKDDIRKIREVKNKCFKFKAVVAAAAAHRREEYVLLNILFFGF